MLTIFVMSITKLIILKWVILKIPRGRYIILFKPSNIPGMILILRNTGFRVTLILPENGYRLLKILLRRGMGVNVTLPRRGGGTGVTNLGLLF